MNDWQFNMGKVVDRNQSIVREGVYSIRTADIGDQYYIIARQDFWDDEPAIVKRLAYKVEIVRTFHEERMYASARWDLITSATHENVYAVKAFAFISGTGVFVFKRYRNDGIRELASVYYLDFKRTYSDEGPRAYWRFRKRLLNLGYNLSDFPGLHALEGGGKLLAPCNPINFPAPSKLLWERHAQILWAFATTMDSTRGDVQWVGDLQGAVRKPPPELAASTGGPL